MVLFSVVVVDYKQFVNFLDRTVEWLWPCGRLKA
jgi:hypothetical protein